MPGTRPDRDVSGGEVPTSAPGSIATKAREELVLDKIMLGLTIQMSKLIYICKHRTPFVYNSFMMTIFILILTKFNQSK